MRKKHVRKTAKPASCTELSDRKERSQVEVNEYHTPPRSPGAASLQGIGLPLTCAIKHRSAPNSRWDGKQTEHHLHRHQLPLLSEERLSDTVSF